MRDVGATRGSVVVEREYTDPVGPERVRVCGLLRMLECVLGRVCVSSVRTQCVFVCGGVCLCDHFYRFNWDTFVQAVMRASDITS
jgi:hypothetical protein